MDEQAKRFKMDNPEQERTRDVSLPQHKDFMSAEQKRKLDEAPSTLKKNLFGAGVDSRGLTKEQYKDSERDFAAEPSNVWGT